MNRRLVTFRWFLAVFGATILLQSLLMSPSVSAQVLNTPVLVATATQEPLITDVNYDGIDDNETELLSSAANSVALPSQQTNFSIGMVTTGRYQHPRDRLVSLGYSVDLIPPTSGLSTFQQYDIIYLPVEWASAVVGNYEIIEARANDYHDYVYQGGRLFIDQPNPYQQPNETVTPSLLPYPITFYNGYVSSDYPPVIVDPNHFITSGLGANELPFPADQMRNIHPFYHILVVGKATRAASLVVGEYGTGRILIQTAHPSRMAFTPFSDAVYIRMVEWVGESSGNNCLGTTDPFEPDNTLATGFPITVGEIQRHTLCPQNDEDWVNFQIPPTLYMQRNYLVETFDLEPDDINPNGDTQLTVTDETGNQIGTNQFRGYGPFPGSPDILQSSRVVWHPAAEGIFNIRVFPEKPINEQEGSGYSLRLVDSSVEVDPVDQGSWSPTKVMVPLVWRSGNLIYFFQYFTYEQAELDALNAVPATLAWEFRRPAVNTDTGEEIRTSNVDYGDYLQSVNGECVRGNYWTNLPNHTDYYTEETNWRSIPGCTPNNLLAPQNEEFEIYVDDTTELVAGKVYYVVIKFYIHEEFLNSGYQFYISKAEYCERYMERFDIVCNIRHPNLAIKKIANLIEGYLQPAP